MSISKISGRSEGGLGGGIFRWRGPEFLTIDWKPESDGMLSSHESN